MQISVTTNFPDIAKRLDTLAADVRIRALTSAMNKTMAQAKTRMGREITKEFNVTAGYVRERLQVRRASFRNGQFRLQAALTGGDGRKRSANVIRFLERSVSLAQARKRASTGTLKQLRFKIRRSGGQRTIPGAFIGNKGRTVFRRTTDKRLPIKAISTVDVAQMFNAKRINARVVASIRENFTRLFESEARFFVAKFNRA